MSNVLSEKLFFKELNENLINIYETHLQYDEENSTINEKIKEKKNFTYDDFIKKYHYFDSDFLLEYIEDSFEPINLDNFKTQFHIKLDLLKNSQTDILLRLPELDEFELNLEEKMKKLNSLKEKLEKEIEELKILKTNESEKSFLEKKNEISKKLDTLQKEKINQFDKKIKQLFENFTILKDKEKEFLQGYNTFLSDFKTKRENFEKNNELRKVDFFSLSNLEGYLERKSLEFNENFSQKVADFKNYIIRNKKNHDEEHSNELVERIKSKQEKQKLLEQEMFELEKAEKEIINEIKETNNKFLEIKKRNDQTTYFRKFIVNIFDCKNSIIILLIIIFLILTIII